MTALIIIAVIVLFVVAIVFQFIYVSTPSNFDPNSTAGRMENRFKREQEQKLYNDVLIPLFKLIAIVVFGGLALLILKLVG